MHCLKDALKRKKRIVVEAKIAFNMKGINWKFLGLFMLYLGIFVGLVQLPQSLYHEALRFTASAVAASGRCFLSRSPVLIHMSPFGVSQWRLSLNALASTMLPYLWQQSSLSRVILSRIKQPGLFVGISVIFLLNLLRLGIIGIIGHYSVSLFSFVHLYLWQALFTLLVLLLWILWVNGKAGFSWLLTKQSLLVMAAASISFWFMITYLSYYLSFIGCIADRIFPLFAGVMSIPASVIAEGRLIGYISGSYIIYSETGLYTLNYAIFLSLAPVVALSSERNLFMKKFTAGTGLMLAFHLGLILMDWSLEVTTDATLSSVLIWCIVLSSMLAPLVSWLCAALLFPSKAKKIV